MLYGQLLLLEKTEKTEACWGGEGYGWADGLTGGAVRTGLEPPTKHP